MKFINPRNWSKYSRRLSGDQEALRQYKRIILLSQFTLVGALVGVIHSLEDFVDGMFFMSIMDLTMAMVIFICYILNESGRHQLSKIMLLSFLNIFFFIYSSLVPKELGIYLYYFPWVGLAAVVFEILEIIFRLAFIVLSVICLITLFATQFNVVGITEYQAVDIDRSLIINMLSSIAVLVF